MLIKILLMCFCLGAALVKFGMMSCPLLQKELQINKLEIPTENKCPNWIPSLNINFALPNIPTRHVIH